MPKHGYVRPGEAQAARRAAKRAVEQRHAELWKDRRGEGLSFAEEGWALWYTDEANLIRLQVRREVAEEIAAEIERVIGGYEEARPKVGCGEFLNDAQWAALIARQIGQGDD